MSLRAEFGLYLESAGPGHGGASLRTQLAAEQVETLRAAWSGQLTLGRTTRDDIRRLLGPPDDSTSNTMGYDLPQRVGYRFCFEFHPKHGVLVSHGYRRLGPAVSRPEVSDWESFARALTALGATTYEVLEWLGAPVSSSGWWPMETWEYPDARHIVFRHGIVTDERDSE